MSAASKHFLYCDGAAEPNPGPASIGIVLYFGDHPVIKACRYLGKQTNNFAEASSLLFGLRLAVAWGVEDIHVFMDSQLIVKQAQGEWQINNQDLLTLHTEIKKYVAKFKTFEIEWIRREKNTVADDLAARALRRMK